MVRFWGGKGGKGGRAEVLAQNSASRTASQNGNGCVSYASGVVGRQSLTTMVVFLDVSGDGDGWVGSVNGRD